MSCLIVWSPSPLHQKRGGKPQTMHTRTSRRSIQNRANTLKCTKTGGRRRGRRRARTVHGLRRVGGGRPRGRPQRGHPCFRGGLARSGVGAWDDGRAGRCVVGEAANSSAATGGRDGATHAVLATALTGGGRTPWAPFACSHCRSANPCARSPFQYPACTAPRETSGDAAPRRRRPGLAAHHRGGHPRRAALLRARRGEQGRRGRNPGDGIPE